MAAFTAQSKIADLAIRDFDTALAIEPNFFEAINSRGIAHKTGRF